MTNLKHIKRNHIQTPLNPSTQNGYFFALLRMGEETDTRDLHNTLYCSLLYVVIQQKYCLFLRSGISHSDDFQEQGFMAGTKVTWPEPEDPAHSVPACCCLPMTQSTVLWQQG